MTKKIVSFIEWVIIGLVALIALMLISLRLFGFNFYSVVSESMGDEIPKGSLVISKICDKDEAKNIITTTPLEQKLVVVCHNDKMSIPVMHQVIDFDDTTVTIHGIANKEGVNEVFPYEEVVGIVWYSVPFVGYLMQGTGLIYTLVITSLVVVGYLVIKQIFIELGKNEDNEIKNKENNIKDIELQ